MPGTIVILGGGQAGGRTAQALRAGGYQGALRLIGAEPCLPYQRPPLSKEFLTGAAGVEAMALGGTPSWGELGLEFQPDMVAARVEARERRVWLSDGGRIGYDALVVATGARPRLLSVPGLADEDVHYLRDIRDALRLRERLEAGGHLCVIGAGVIGLEIAAAARGRGMAVTIVERDPEPLGRIAPPAVGARLRRLHERAGSVFHRGAVPLRAVKAGGAHVLDLSDGTRIEADAIAAGIGVVPNVELLAGAGLALDDGVLTDAACRTADPAILAVGDVARSWRPLLGRAVRLESWRNAEEQPAVAAAALLGGDASYDAVPWMWSDQFDTSLQVAGTPLEADTVVERPAGGEGGSFLYLRDGVLVGGVTIDRSRDMRPIQRLIAARARPDPARLADPLLPLADLVRPMAGAGAGQ